MMNVSLLSFAITILLGILWGKKVEDDDERGNDILQNITNFSTMHSFGYAVNTGHLQESTSRLPFGITIAGLEILRSLGPFVAIYNDAGSIVDCMVDVADYTSYSLGWSTDTAVDDLVTRGAYSGLDQW